MSSLAFSKLIFIFSVISIFVTSNADEFEFVDNVCAKLGNDPFCLQVLKSDTRSKFAKDVTTLTTIAVDLATKNSTATRDYFRGVTTGPPAVLKSLQDCVGMYDTVIKSLAISMKEEECSLTSYDIHAAGDEVRRCQAVADANGAHDSFITTSNDITAHFCRLGESLANLMCK